MVFEDILLAAVKAASKIAARRFSNVRVAVLIWPAGKPWPGATMVGADFDDKGELAIALRVGSDWANGNS